LKKISKCFSPHGIVVSMSKSMSKNMYDNIDKGGQNVNVSMTLQKESHPKTTSMNKRIAQKFRKVKKNINKLLKRK